MQLLLILAVVAALAVSESLPAQPVADGPWRLGAALLGMGLTAGFAAVTSGMVALGLRYEVDRRAHWLVRFGQLRTIHTSLWVIITGVILFWLGWPQMVRFNWQLADVFLVDELLILAPVVVPMILSWAAFYEVDKTLHREGATAVDASLLARGRLAYVSFYLRHELGLLLLPILALLALRDGVQLLAPQLLEDDLSPTLFVPALVLLFICFPLLLKSIWPTTPLPAGALRSRLEATATRLRFRARDILVWNTGGRMVNAVVTGLVAPLRYVLLTDGVIDEFSEDELEAVFAHEVGHVRHHHLLLRVLALLAPVVAFLAWQKFFPDAIALQSRWLAEHGLPVAFQGPLLLISGLGTYGLSVFGMYSRLLEHEADLFACQALSPAPAGLAVERFTVALEKIGAATGLKRDAATWLHPSIASRTALLVSFAHTPARRQRFARQMQLLRVLIIGLVASSLACLVL